jgi:hypothetical protein
MTDQPIKPRRRWKRWAALVLILAIGCGVWVTLTESRDIALARGLQLGMAEDRVIEIMGTPNARAMEGVGFRSRFLYGSIQTQAILLLGRVRQMLGYGFNPDLKSWPVEVGFDDAGRVNYIRRGSEVVGR